MQRLTYDPIISDLFIAKDLRQRQLLLIRLTPGRPPSTSNRSGRVKKVPRPTVVYVVKARA